MKSSTMWWIFGLAVAVGLTYWLTKPAPAAGGSGGGTGGSNK